MTIRLIPFFCLIGFVGSIQAQDPRDVKFYNLEKEYRTTNTYIYKPKNAKALELKQILRDMLSQYGVVYINEQSNEIYITDVAEKIADLKNVIASLDVSGITAGNNLVSEVIYLTHDNVADLEPLIRHKLSNEGRMFQVPAQNALAITDIPSKIAEVKALLAALDVPVKHIAIDITIVEFNNQNFSRLGINLFNWLQELNVYVHAQGNTPADLTKNAIVELRSPTRYGWGLPQFDAGKALHVSGGIGLSDIVQFICENGDGSVLASTRLITKNSKETKLWSRERIPVSFSEHEDMQRQSWDYFADAGISVTVKPDVQEDSLINLVIDPSISDLTGWSPKGMPIIFDRSLHTEVKVKNNALFALGGLKKRETIKVRRGIPGLRDVPVLKYLFSVEHKVDLEREVLMFIRPTIISSVDVNSAPVQQMMEEYQKRMGTTRHKKR